MAAAPSDADLADADLAAPPAAAAPPPAAAAPAPVPAPEQKELRKSRKPAAPKRAAPKAGVREA